MHVTLQDADVETVIKDSDLLGHGHIVRINLPKAISAWLVQFEHAMEGTERERGRGG